MFERFVAPYTILDALEGGRPAPGGGLGSVRFTRVELPSMETVVSTEYGHIADQ